MTTFTVPALNSTIEKTHRWLKELLERGQFDHQAQAYSAFRAVLHALRDRLPAGEAAHLAAQLPMLVRGFYYEGWRPAAEPTRQRTAQEFIETVRERLRENPDIDPAYAARVVFAFLAEKISAGEIEDIRRILPEEIRSLWPKEKDEDQARAQPEHALAGQQGEGI